MFLSNDFSSPDHFWWHHFFVLFFQLSQFLESLTSKLTSEGDLDGILLTGEELLSPHFITKVQIIREQLLSIIDKMPESKVTWDSSANILESWLEVK